MQFTMIPLPNRLIALLAMFSTGFLGIHFAHGNLPPESSAKTVVDSRYSAATGKTPSEAPGLGFAASQTGQGSVADGILRTTDTDASGDGRYYALPASATKIDPTADVTLSFVVAVRRSAGSRTATAIELALPADVPRLGPLTRGNHGEGYQDILFDGRQLSLGLISDGEHHDRDEILLIDATRPGDDAIIGRRQVPLDEPHRFTLQIRRAGPGADDDRVTLSVDVAGVESLSVPLSRLQSTTISPQFGLLFGHPAGPGLAEAEWRELSLLVTRPRDGAGSVAQSLLPYAIDQRRQLLVDDFLIERLDRLVREQGQPVKASGNPVLKRKEPWEASRCELYGSAIWNPEARRIELFYSATQQPYDAKLALATSNDKGLTWTRPALEVFPWQGKPSNIVWPGRYWTHGPSVLYDPHDADPNRRYKLFLTAAPLDPSKENPQDGPKGIDAVFSPDGIHWKAAPQNPVIPGFNSDTGNCIIWDDNRNLYRAYIRIRCNIGRSVGLAESTDFIHWTEPRTIYTPTSFDHAQQCEYYGLSVTMYEGLYVGLVWIFPNTPASADMKADTPVTWPELVTSHDGEHWHRPFIGVPFLPLGAKGEFDHRQIRPASSFTLLDDGIALLYSGSPHAHVAGHLWDIGLATLRQDGFAALRAMDQEGSILTRPITLAGGTLVINANVSDGGYVKAELLDVDENVIKGYGAFDCQAITGDRVQAAVAWKNHQTLPPSTANGVRLRFLVKNARLYSFQVAP